MVQKILTALDGTKASESVLPYLETLLASQDANVTLVRATPGGSTARTREATAYLARIAEALRAKGAVVDIHVPSGKPAPTLVDLAVRGNYSLILMGSHGRSGLPRLLLGSVAEEVLRRSPLPLLIVPPRTTAMEKPKLKRIVVPLDGSHRSAAILPHVAILAKATGARLLFTTVVEPHAREEIPVEVLAKSLFRDQKNLLRQGIPTELIIRYGNPADEILSLGDVQNADLVALSTHGRTGLERARFGSVAESILRRGRRPLLLVRTSGRFVSDPIRASEIRAERRRQLETAGSRSR
jgi:nucleotide-binding universal stress UspA family protein